MVIGTGLVGDTFRKHSTGNDNLCVFASGVSNSKEKSIDKFNRELKLLKNTLKSYPDYTFVYFSTLSTFCNNSTPYTEHKRNMENYIKSTFKNYLIIRLPIVVGKFKNEYQLVPFLEKHLDSCLSVPVFKNTFRNLIDVQDLPVIVNYFANLQTTDKSINVQFNNEIAVEDIVKHIAKIKKIEKYNLEYVDAEQAYYVDNSLFLQELKNIPWIFNKNPYDILNKYIQL